MPNYRQEVLDKLEFKPVTEVMVAPHSPGDVLSITDEIELSKAISLKRIADNLDWARSVFTSPNAKRVIGLAMADLEAELSDKLEP